MAFLLNSVHHIGDVLYIQKKEQPQRKKNEVVTICPASKEVKSFSSKEDRMQYWFKLDKLRTERILIQEHLYDTSEKVTLTQEEIDKLIYSLTEAIDSLSNRMNITKEVIISIYDFEKEGHH